MSKPDVILQTISDKGFAIIGIEPDDSERLSAAFHVLNAYTGVFDPATIEPGDEELSAYDVLILRLNAETARTSWLVPDKLVTNNVPLLIVGDAFELFEYMPVVQNYAHDFIVGLWNHGEIVLRCFQLLSRIDAVKEKTTEANVTPTVVIADDDWTTINIVATSLRQGGINPQLARDGQQALDLIKAHPPDAIVLDVNMPVLDGFQVLEALRATENGKQIPVLVLTGSDNEQDFLRGFELGANDYLTKPFHHQELVARLKRLLGKPI